MGALKKFAEIIIIFSIIILNFTNSKFIAIENLREKRDIHTEELDSGLLPNEVDEDSFDDSAPEIYSFNVNSDIRFRYARTTVTSKLVNKNRHKSSEAIFQVVLPEPAFISKFIIEIDGKIYESYVKEKEEARQTYEDARSRGETAGLLEVNPRHAHIFTVNLNLKPLSKVTFNLTYEEFLLKKFGRYEHVINIRPEQFNQIRDFNIDINIHESQNLTLLQVPNLQGEIEQDEERLEEFNNQSIIERRNGHSAKIHWTPSLQDQLRWKDKLGKFVVYYDIQHESNTGEILLMNGYFVHFFAPSDIPPLRKHVIYVLDTSGSMKGEKINQLKDVMSTVLDDLKPDDYFNIIEFSSLSNFWNPNSEEKRDLNKSDPFPLPATERNLRLALTHINSMVAVGGTNIDDAVKDALEISNRVKSKELIPNVESMILFLTDGEATNGEENLERIIENSKKRNKGRTPIYTLAFGGNADFGFLKNLAMENYGFGRKIYEGSDADIQIRGFYKEISSPLLSNITFKYTSNSTFKKLTRSIFPRIFNGSELVVAGEYKSTGVDQLAIDVDANGRDGRVSLKGRMALGNESINPEDQFLERLWAYITIKQLLENDNKENDVDNYEYEDFGENGGNETEEEDNGELLPPIAMASLKRNETAKDRALRLALKYKFVTPITSLVVVKPNETDLNPVEELVNLNEPQVLSKSFPSKTMASTPAQKGPPGNNRAMGSSRGSPVRGGRRQSSRNRGGVQGRDIPKPTNTNSQTEIKTIAASGMRVYNAMRIPDHINEIPFARQSLAVAERRAYSIRGDSLNLPESFDFKAATQDRGRPSTLDFRPQTPIMSVGPMWRPRFSTTTEKPVNNLELIQWGITRDEFGIGYLSAYDTTYIVANINTMSIPRGDGLCTGGTRHNRFQGRCKHLKDCVKTDFVNDFNKYLDSYFCAIPAKNIGGTPYAGVCCN